MWFASLDGNREESFWCGHVGHSFPSADDQEYASDILVVFRELQRGTCFRRDPRTPADHLLEPGLHRPQPADHRDHPQGLRADHQGAAQLVRREQGLRGEDASRQRPPAPVADCGKPHMDVHSCPVVLEFSAGLLELFSEMFSSKYDRSRFVLCVFSSVGFQRLGQATRGKVKRKRSGSLGLRFS